MSLFTNKTDRLKNLQAVFKKIDEQALLAAVNCIENGKRYLGKNSTIVKGPSVDYDPDCGDKSYGKSTWLCKTVKENWFLLEVTFNSEITNKPVVKPISAEVATEYLLHHDLLLCEEYFGEVEEA